MLLTDDFLKRWEDIVDQVEKSHIPIDVVRKVVFRNQERRQKTINLVRLRNQGLEDDEIEHVVNRYIQENEDEIASMEFVLDIERVADILQPETDKILKGI